VAEFRGFTAIFICGERSFPNRFAKISFGTLHIVTSLAGGGAGAAFSRNRANPQTISQGGEHTDTLAEVVLDTSSVIMLAHRLDKSI